jgi:hypothetical protein
VNRQTLEHCLGAPDEAAFAVRLRHALLALPLEKLPLHLACNQGGFVKTEDLSVSVLASKRSADLAVCRVGFFFTERVGGCNCHDDPLEVAAYGVFEVRLSRDGPAITCRYLGDG